MNNRYRMFRKTSRFKEMKARTYKISENFKNNKANLKEWQKKQNIIIKIKYYNSSKEHQKKMGLNYICSR